MPPEESARHAGTARARRARRPEEYASAQAAEPIGAGLVAPGEARISAAFARRLPELAAPWRSARPERPELLVLNEPLACELGLDPAALRTEHGIRFLLGNELPEGAQPVAQAYAGHQFGMYAPRLGDGRALLLGEITDTIGRVRDLHLKGSGPTPFARADGFAAVGPMLREYLLGEAMHALGIPTTRALAVVATGRPLLREDALDPPPGAVLVRVAASHLRVGSFQYARSLGGDGGRGAASGGDSGSRTAAQPSPLRSLADFAIARHYPRAAAAGSHYLALLDAVIAAQARLVAQWMLVGFVHGVMNTDNVTISGETIDYGPCAFIDAYDPAAVFSSIDRGGRYAYGRQPAIAVWNLARLAEALLPLFGDDPESAKELAVAALDGFAEHYNAAWGDGMRAKLGLASTDSTDQGSGSRVSVEAVSRLTAGLQHDLQAHRVDYTGAFRALAEAARGDDAAFRALLGPGAEPGEWFAEWLMLRPDAAAMDAANPVCIPRNHLVDEALEAAAGGDLAPFERLLSAVRHPYEAQPGFERYALPAPPGSAPHVTYCGT